MSARFFRAGVAWVEGRSVEVDGGTRLPAVITLLERDLRITVKDVYGLTEAEFAELEAKDDTDRNIRQVIAKLKSLLVVDAPLWLFAEEGQLLPPNAARVSRVVCNLQCVCFAPHPPCC